MVRVQQQRNFSFSNTVSQTLFTARFKFKIPLKYEIWACSQSLLPGTNGIHHSSSAFGSYVNKNLALMLLLAWQGLHRPFDWLEYG